MCNEAAGYKNNCTATAMATDNSTVHSQCRVCATCKKNWKRKGSTAKCQECPPSTTNRLWLAVGILIMLSGTSTLIYLEITSESSKDETSDTVKKIILNFLQIASLASSLPLQWPQALYDMFESFDTISSAGTTLLVPDCELSHLDAAEAFYYKQIFYTFLIPIVVVLCVIVWSILGCVCKKMKHHKDYMVLSIVMLLFLLYPKLVKLTLSMLRCPKIGDRSFLMVSLEEPCFEGKHLQYTMMLTIPQIFLYVIGLPVTATIHLLRNKDNLHDRQFSTRYGLLYLG